MCNRPIAESDSTEPKQEESVSVELTEADFLNPIALAAAKEKLFAGVCADQNCDCADGTAGARILVRPHISIVRAVLNVLIPLVVCAAVFCVLFFTVKIHTLGISLGVSLGSLGFYIILRLRAILIWFIHVYQRLAPDETRLRCVFTPSCSEYAEAVLKKYGVVRGVPKIISRLKRCCPPNGGEDLP